MNDEQLENNILELTNIVGSMDNVVQNTPDVDKEAQIWAFQGVHGGAGVTSLIVQMAFELAVGDKNHKGPLPQVLLIDLDFERGSCSPYLDIPCSLKIEELNEAAGRMDDALAQTFIRKCGQNLSIISAEGELGGNDIINPHALLALLDKVAVLYDFILLDVPQMWRSWTQSVIGASDKFTLVMEPSVPALHRAKALSGSISEAMELPQAPNIILNKFERRSLRNGVTLKDAVHVLERDDLLTVSIDEDVLRQSINSGQPAGQFKAESRYAKSIREIVKSWKSETEASEDRRDVRRRA